MFSDGEGQQPSSSTGFQGWSDDEVEGDEPTVVANIVRHLEEDQQDSHVGMDGDGSKSNIVGIVPEGQVMVDMAARSKATESGATMDRLRCLRDDIIELSRQLNHKMELAALALFDKVKAGFSGTGGVAQQFVGNMSKLATDFFMDTRVYEAQLDSADSEAFHSAVLALQERVDALLRQAAALEETYKHSRASFDNILATMCQEIHDFANQASRRLCNEYKRHSFDRIAQDHPFMDVMPFVSNIIQNVCTFDTLLTSHQLGWSVVPLQILMAPILTEAAATPCVIWSSFNTSPSGPCTYSNPFGCLMPHLHLCLCLAQQASILNLSRRTPAAPGPKLVILTLQRLVQLLALTLLSRHPNLQ